MVLEVLDLTRSVLNISAYSWTIWDIRSSLILFSQANCHETSSPSANGITSLPNAGIMLDSSVSPALPKSPSPGDFIHKKSFSSVRCSSPAQFLMLCYSHWWVSSFLDPNFFIFNISTIIIKMLFLKCRASQAISHFLPCFNHPIGFLQNKTATPEPGFLQSGTADLCRLTSYHICPEAYISIILKCNVYTNTNNSVMLKRFLWVSEEMCSFKHLHLCTSSSLDSDGAAPRKLCLFSLKVPGKLYCVFLQLIELISATRLCFYFMASLFVYSCVL